VSEIPFAGARSPRSPTFIDTGLATLHFPFVSVKGAKGANERVDGYGDLAGQELTSMAAK
jgi:hypothetical protein